MKSAVLATLALCSGCTFLVSDKPDAGSGDGELRDAMPGPDGPNNNSFERPYDCDADTIALYHFDDGSNDDACGDNNLVGDAIITLAGPPRFSSARLFSGGQLMTASATSNMILPGAFTIEAWVFPKQLPDASRYSYVAAVNDTDQGVGQRNWYLALNDVGNVVVTTALADCMMLNPDDGEATAISIGTDNWTHLAFAYDGASYVVRVNGAVELDLPIVGTFCAQTNAALAIGANVGNRTQYFEGIVDEVRYSRVAR